MRRQSVGRNARRHFMLSGFSSDKKVELCMKIKNLGGIYNETEHFEIESTHIVCKKPSRSEKFLGGCATGKWLLVESYIDESSRHGRWLPETDFEWGPKWNCTLDLNSQMFMYAPRKWREKVEARGGGAFSGWRCAVLVENPTKKMVYKKLLELGGAYIHRSASSSASSSAASTPTKQGKASQSSLLEEADSLTHVFADESHMQMVEPLLLKGVFCLKPLYIGDFLLLPNSPDPNMYKLGVMENKHDPAKSSTTGAREVTNNKVSVTENNNNKTAESAFTKTQLSPKVNQNKSNKVPANNLKTVKSVDGKVKPFKRLYSECVVKEAKVGKEVPNGTITSKCTNKSSPLKVVSYITGNIKKTPVKLQFEDCSSGSSDGEELIVSKITDLSFSHRGIVKSVSDSTVQLSKLNQIDDDDDDISLTQTTVKGTSAKASTTQNFNDVSMTKKPVNRNNVIMSLSNKVNLKNHSSKNSVTNGINKKDIVTLKSNNKVPTASCTVSSMKSPTEKRVADDGSVYIEASPKKVMKAEMGEKIGLNKSASLPVKSADYVAETPTKKRKLDSPALSLTPKPRNARGRRTLSKDCISLQKLNQSSMMSFLTSPKTEGRSPSTTPLKPQPSNRILITTSGNSNISNSISKTSLPGKVNLATSNISRCSLQGKSSFVEKPDTSLFTCSGKANIATSNVSSKTLPLSGQINLNKTHKTHKSITSPEKVPQPRMIVMGSKNGAFKPVSAMAVETSKKVTISNDSEQSVLVDNRTGNTGKTVDQTHSDYHTRVSIQIDEVIDRTTTTKEKTQNKASLSSYSSPSKSESNSVQSSPTGLTPCKVVLKDIRKETSVLLDHCYCKHRETTADLIMELENNESVHVCSLSQESGRVLRSKSNSPLPNTEGANRQNEKNRTEKNYLEIPQIGKTLRSNSPLLNNKKRHESEKNSPKPGCRWNLRSRSSSPLTLEESSKENQSSCSLLKQGLQEMISKAKSGRKCMKRKLSDSSPTKDLNKEIDDKSQYKIADPIVNVSYSALTDSSVGISSPRHNSNLKIPTDETIRNTVPAWMNNANPSIQITHSVHKVSTSQVKNQSSTSQVCDTVPADKDFVKEAKPTNPNMSRSNSKYANVQPEEEIITYKFVSPAKKPQKMREASDVEVESSTLKGELGEPGNSRNEVVAAAATKRRKLSTEEDSDCAVKESRNQKQAKPKIGVGRKAKFCGDCKACLSKDCGQCLFCLDKTKFGGLNIKKQKCLQRRCVKFLQDSQYKAIDSVEKLSTSRTLLSEPSTSKTVTVETSTSKTMSSELSTSKTMTSELSTSKTMSSELSTSKTMSSELSTSKTMSSELSTSKTMSSELSTSKTMSSELSTSKTMSSELSTSKTMSSELSTSKTVSSVKDLVKQDQQLGLSISHEDMEIDPPGNEVKKGAIQTKKRKNLTEDEKIMCALALSRKQKQQLTTCDFDYWGNADLFASDSNKDKRGKAAFPMSENYTAIYETCLEDDQLISALDVLSSSICTTRYPQARTLYSLMINILQEADTAILAEQTCTVLHKVLALHPPHTPTMQNYYLRALKHPSVADTDAQGVEWQFVQNIIRNAINECSDDKQDESASNNLLILKFLVSMFEKDLLYSGQRRHRSRSSPKTSLLAQVLWPSGALAVGRINTACQELLSMLIDATQIADHKRKVEVMGFIQTLISITAHSCHASNQHVTGSNPGHYPSDKVVLFARELAIKIKGNMRNAECVELVLTTMKPVWLTMFVCEHLLEFYDESLLPLLGEYDDKCLSLKKITAKYFYLLPPLTCKSVATNTSAFVSPHKKKTEAENSNNNSSQSSTGSAPSPQRKLKSTPLKTLADSNHVVDFKAKPAASSPAKSAVIAKRILTKVNKRNPKGETALHKACMANNVPKIRELLQTPGIDINISDYAGWTPLHEACNRGHAEAVLELMQYKPAKNITSFFSKDTFDKQKLNLLACDEEGITPLHDAVDNNHKQVVRILLQYGGKQLLAAKTVTGLTPLHMATSADVLHLLENPPEEITSNVKKGVKKPRLYKSVSSQDMMSSQGSQGHQSMSQTLCEEKCFQPSTDIYNEVLGAGGSQRTVCTNELQRFACIVCYLLKAYIELYHIITCWLTCKNYEEGTLDLGKLTEEGDNTLNDETSSKEKSNVNNHVDMEKEVFSPIKDPPCTASTSVRQSSRRRARNALLDKLTEKKTPTKTENNKRNEDSTTKLTEFELFKEDFELYKDLKYHVRGFQSHLRLLSGDGDWSDAFIGKKETSVHSRVQTFVNVMRSLHLS